MDSLAEAAVAAQPVGCVRGILGRWRRYQADLEGGLRGKPGQHLKVLDTGQMTVVGEHPPFEHLVVDVRFYRRRTSIIRRLTTQGNIAR